MMWVLAVESSTTVCSVAVVCGKTVRAQARCDVQGKHSAYVLSMVKQVLSEAGRSGKDLDAIAFGAGPGAFTGLRLALSVAQGLAFGWDCPLISVSSLAALAYRVHAMDDVDSACPIWVVQDARMGQVYAGFYRLDGAVLTPFKADDLYDPESLVLPSQEDGWWVLGSGYGCYRDHWDYVALNIKHLADTDHPCASDLALLAASGQGVSVAVDQATPHYCRAELT